MTTRTPLVGRFDKLLIANRGEIACRIIRTARSMGIGTVAVFSQADRDALHVSMADEAVLVGPAPASESYLDIDAIIAAARRSGAQAIHPGYGFLSENEAFAAACADAGLIFLGPSVDVIRTMGSKSAAKTLMMKSGVPLVPGYHGAAQDVPTLLQAASKIGFPVLVKASAGGGGRGMRIVQSGDDLADAVSSAKREAATAFGDDHLLIEKYVTKPRHIEVQIFGDTHGNIVSLFERECTLQRRHQKVIEEAPSSTLSQAARDDICNAARAAGAAVGYTGAGTVEFIADRDGFYFIEMNTRLQVEHPVTEMITGIDLVEWQIRVAFGEVLPLGQADITCKGHAFEARIYAEDPERGFLPSSGVVTSWRQPATGSAIRIDTGFRQGDAITSHYDPMIAKLIVHGDDRAQALALLSRGLDDLQIGGIRTNTEFLRALIRHGDVRAGEMDTGLIERELPVLLSPMQELPEDSLAAAVGAALHSQSLASQPNRSDPWESGDGWMIAGRRKRQFVFATDDATVEATLIYERDGLSIELPSSQAPLSIKGRSDDKIDVFLGDTKQTVSAAWSGRNLELVTPRGRFQLQWVEPMVAEETDAAASGNLEAPMAGVIRQVFASPGDSLKRGDAVLTMEAMKMEHKLTAPADGTLVSLKCAVGDFTQEGTLLAEFEAEGASG